MDAQTSLEGTYQNDNVVDPFRITHDQFLADHNGKTRGTANPSIMDKPFWKYMITRGGSAYSARQLFHNEGSAKEGEMEYVKYSDWPSDPVWCFSRFGGTVTKLPDGRCVHIGGEHEDFYDPDFCIYNDMVVIATPQLSNPATSSIPEDDIPDDYDITPSRVIAPENITIYGYPLDVFPPTDFHTATYVCDPRNGREFIYIIGGLGYESSASRDRTDVYRLDLSDFSIQQLETIGAKPLGDHHRGWQAILVAHEYIGMDLAWLIANLCPKSNPSSSGIGAKQVTRELQKRIGGEGCRGFSESAFDTIRAFTEKPTCQSCQ